MDYRTNKRTGTNYIYITRQKNQIDDHLDHLIVPCRSEVLCRICIVQVQPRNPVLDGADYTAPTRQDELDHTDQKHIFPGWQI